jgi:NAD kinase
MAEPITMTLSALLWEYGLKPIADSIKKEYGDETKKLLKSSLKGAFEKLSLQPKEQELIEAEIIEADIDVLSDQDRFLEFIQDNQNIKNIQSILEDSVKDIEESEIIIELGGDTTLKNSVKDIKNSTIKIR